MRKNMLTGVSVAFMAAATITIAQTTTTTDQTKRTGLVSQPGTSRTSATPDLPLDMVGIPDASLGTDYDTISKGCENLFGLKTRFRITGTMRGRRVDAEVRLGVVPGLTMRLEPVVQSGSPQFVLQANDGSGNQLANDEHGTLFIRQGNRVVRDKVAALMNAVIGVPISERELFEIFTCPTFWAGVDLARLGPDWFRLVTPYGEEALLETYLHRDASHAWAYAAAIHHALTVPERKWRIDFLERRHEVFGRLRIRSMNWLGEMDRQDDITLLREFASLDADGIPVAETIPATAREISLADLKGAIPLITAPSIQRSPSRQVREPARR